MAGEIMRVREPIAPGTGLQGRFRAGVLDGMHVAVCQKDISILWRQPKRQRVILWLLLFIIQFLGEWIGVDPFAG